MEQIVVTNKINKKSIIFFLKNIALIIFTFDSNYHTLLKLFSGIAFSGLGGLKIQNFSKPGWYQLVTFN